MGNRPEAVEWRHHPGCLPPTNIQESLQKLKGAKIFTSIDACGAYHPIQIEEGSRDCTVFISPMEHFVTYACLSAYLKAEVYIVGFQT